VRGALVKLENLSTFIGFLIFIIVFFLKISVVLAKIEIIDNFLIA